MSAIETLRDEFALDPLKVGYAAMTDQERHDSIKAVVIDAKRTIPSADLLLWAALSTRKRKIDTVSKTVGGAANMADIAAILFFRDGFELNVEDERHMSIIDSLITIGGLDSEDKTSLYALAGTKVSRLSQLGISDVHLGDIGAARK